MLQIVIIDGPFHIGIVIVISVTAVTVIHVIIIHGIGVIIMALIPIEWVILTV